MVITTSKDVTKQGFCKGSEENSVFGRVSLLSLIGVCVGGSGVEVGVGVFSRLGAYQLFLPLGWALIRSGR